MLDPGKEPLLSLREAAKLLPSRRRGRPVSQYTLYRWCRTGYHGVLLEFTQLPSGHLMTTSAALGRFFEAVKRLRDRRTGHGPSGDPGGARARLEAAGWA